MFETLELISREEIIAWICVAVIGFAFLGLMVAEATQHTDKFMGWGILAVAASTSVFLTFTPVRFHIDPDMYALSIALAIFLWFAALFLVPYSISACCSKNE